MVRISELIFYLQSPLLFHVVYVNYKSLRTLLLLSLQNYWKFSSRKLKGRSEKKLNNLLTRKKKIGRK